MDVVPAPQTFPDDIEGNSKVVCEGPYADIRVSPICVIHQFAQFVIGHRYIEVPLILECMGCPKKGV